MKTFGQLTAGDNIYLYFGSSEGFYWACDVNDVRHDENDGALLLDITSPLCNRTLRVSDPNSTTCEKVFCSDIEVLKKMICDNFENLIAEQHLIISNANYRIDELAKRRNELMKQISES